MNVKKFWKLTFMFVRSLRHVYSNGAKEREAEAEGDREVVETDQRRTNTSAKMYQNVNVVVEVSSVVIINTECHNVLRIRAN